MAFLSSCMPLTLCSKMKTTGTFAKKKKMRRRRTWLVERTKACEIEDRWVVVLLLLHCMSSTTEAQRAEDYENGGSVNKKGNETNSERKKSEKEGKTLPFISPRRIKSKPLDHVQYTSTAGGSETRSTAGIRGLFKSLNQRSWSRESETSYTLMMRGVLPKH